MTLDWNNFTASTALAGGVLIGIAVGLFVLLTGRIAGISGVLGGLLRPARADIGWRVAFVAGLVAAPLLHPLFAPMTALRIDASLPVLIVAGLLVGVGMRCLTGRANARRRRHYAVGIEAARGGNNGSST